MKIQKLDFMLGIIKNEFKMMVFANRLNRLRFLSYIGFTLFIAGIITIIGASFPHHSSIIKYIVSFLFLAMCALIFWWTTKRIHDIGASAKWLWVLFTAAFVCLLFSFITAKTVLLTKTFFALGVTCCFTLLIIIAISIYLPGSNTKNVFGSPAPPNNFFNHGFAILFYLFSLVSRG